MRRTLTFVVAAAALAVASFALNFVPVEPATAMVFAGSTLAMAVPGGNPGLHPAAQHVINALEAHFNAIGDALSKGAPDWLKSHVEAAFADVKAKLDELGAEFAQEFEALKARVTGKPAAAAEGQPPADKAA